MAGFLDNFRWPECECIDWSERRNAVASVVAGILVSGRRVWRHLCLTFPPENWSRFLCTVNNQDNTVFVGSSFCFKYLFVYFWPCWVFVAAFEPSLVAVPMFLIAVTSLLEERRLWGTWASVVAARGLQCSGQQLWCMGSVVSLHARSSRTRDWTCVPCTGRQILNCYITREVLFKKKKNAFY